MARYVRAPGDAKLVSFGKPGIVQTLANAMSINHLSGNPTYQACQEYSLIAGAHTRASKADYNVS